ncbi:hypothetical protein FACS1894190_06650 [Spirochaetia bacterium]|nr:hypothetical protein FACS1894190_06650 [Spirochaetia bacterium]
MLLNRDTVKSNIIKEARRLYLSSGPDGIFFPGIETNLALGTGTIETYYKTAGDLIDELAGNTSSGLIDDYQKGKLNLIIENDNKNPDLRITPYDINGQRVDRIDDCTISSYWENRIRLNLPGDNYRKYNELMFDVYFPCLREDDPIKQKKSLLCLTVKPALLAEPNIDEPWLCIETPKAVSIKGDNCTFRAIFPTGDTSPSFWQTTVYIDLDRVSEQELDTLKAVILLLQLGNAFKGNEIYISNIGFSSNQ